MARKKVHWFQHGSWWQRIRLNRKYKDRLFRFLFRDKRDLLDLYNALNGTAYENPDDFIRFFCRWTWKRLPGMPLPDTEYQPRPQWSDDWALPSALGVFGICFRGSGADPPGKEYRRSNPACHRLLCGARNPAGYFGQAKNGGLAYAAYGI